MPEGVSGMIGEYVQSKEEEEGDEFDDTLEQLMTLDNTNNQGASMITDNAGEGGDAKAKGGDESKSAMSDS